MRIQFFQSLVDNFQQRFPPENFLQVASCLNQKMWPKDPLRKALYGEKCVAELCKGIYFDIAGADSAKIIVDYAIFKQTDGAVIGEGLQLLVKLLQVLPIFLLPSV